LIRILQPESTGKFRVKVAVIVESSCTVATASALEIAATVIVAKSETVMVGLVVVFSMLQPLLSYVERVNPLLGAAE
jgi:hypothetical protein